MLMIYLVMSHKGIPPNNQSLELLSSETVVQLSAG